MTRPPSEQTQRGVVAVIAREGRLLVVRRSKWVRAPGAYCFPGGGIEAGESETAALVRELLEELAVEVRPVRRLWRSTTPWGVSLAWWLAELDSGAALRPDQAEVESVHWLELGELQELEALLESNRDFIAAWQAGVFRLPMDFG